MDEIQIEKGTGTVPGPFISPNPPENKLKAGTKADESSSKTQKETNAVADADLKFEQLAERKGYIKKPTEEPDSVKQFKIAMLTYIILILGDLIIFFSNAIINGAWHFTPILWQILIMALIKDTSVGLVGKILKYYNMKDEKL